jgi:pyruvate dehydrogenase E2 component (dihydrolipoamide acetyltransferase)
MVEITMPQLSDSMAEGRLLRWCVSVGSAVKAGDVIAEVETDKANMEIEVLEDGVIASLLAAPGDSIPVGSVIATIEPGTVAVPSEGADLGDAAAEYVLDEDGGTAPQPMVTAEQPAGPPPPPVSPVAARLAAMYNVDLSAVKGTGPGGRIMKEDVLAHRSGYPRGEGLAPVPPEVGQRTSVPIIGDEPPEPSEAEPEPSADNILAPDDIFGGIPGDHDTSPPASPPALTASATGRPLASDQPTPVNPPQAAEQSPPASHPALSPLVCASAEVCAEDMLHSLPALQAVLGHEWADVDPDSFVVPVCVRAAALALRWSHGSASTGSVALGVVTDTAVHFPVVRDAAAKPFRSLIEACAALPPRARHGELTPADLGGADLALVFLGRYGLDTVTGLPGPDGAPLLSLGMLTERPVVRGAATLTGRAMTATLTFDPGRTPPPAAFALMREFRRIVENPLLLALA